MNEYPSSSSEFDDTTEAEIEYLMDTRGISHREAQELLGLGERPVTGFSATESERLYQARHAPARQYRHFESRRDGEAFPVIDTSGMTSEQAAINHHGAELARLALHQNDPAQTSEDKARERAKKERQARNY
jgi:hypothetical protein